MLPISNNQVTFFTSDAFPNSATSQTYTPAHSPNLPCGHWQAYGPLTLSVFTHCISSGQTTPSHTSAMPEHRPSKTHNQLEDLIKIHELVEAAEKDEQKGHCFNNYDNNYINNILLFVITHMKIVQCFFPLWCPSSETNNHRPTTPSADKG